MSDSHKPVEEYPGWVLWLYQYGFVTLLSIGVLGMLVVAVSAYLVERRIEHLEERIASRPPKSYSPPDLDAYAAVGFNPADVVREESVYVPVYSHVYYGGGRPFLLEATLSIRNTSSNSPVYVKSVRYYNTEGSLVKEPVDRVIMLKPLQTIEFVVTQRDSSGGSGANFIVDWIADSEVSEPLIETLMVGNAGTQGLVFVRKGSTLLRKRRPNKSVCTTRGLEVGLS